MKKNILSILLAIFAITFLTGFFGGKGGTPEEHRSSIEQMAKETLNDLYRLKPSAKNEVSSAYGYAVFSNVGINVLVVSTANGYGVAHSNKSGKSIYMKMISGGVGVGYGIKDFRGVFIFTTEGAFRNFVDSGWAANAQADAAAKVEKTGDAAAMAVEVAPGISLYQITKNGLALQATIQGTKYYKDNSLN